MDEIYFSNLAVEAGICDVETTKKVYYALVRQIVHSVGKGQDYICPDFGTFSLLEHKARRIKNVNTGEHSIASPFAKVVFKPEDAFRDYVKRKNPLSWQLRYPGSIMGLRVSGPPAL